jgi:hypothetical protein
MTASPPFLPLSAGALFRRAGETDGDTGDWLRAAEEAYRLTLELRRQLGLGERLLWACRSGGRLVVHVSDPAAAAAARFAGAAYVRRFREGTPLALVVRLGPPCPPARPAETRPPPACPESPLARLLERVRRHERRDPS